MRRTLRLSSVQRSYIFRGHCIFGLIALALFVGDDTVRDMVRSPRRPTRGAPGMDLPRVLTALAGDLLPIVTGLPLGSTLAESVHRLIDGRHRQAKDVLVEELRQGRAFVETIAEVDELAAIFLKYIRAAEEGTARLNLRLMAMTIRGMAHKRTLAASRFLYYAGFLATLTREEVIAIATLYKNEALEPDRISDSEARGPARVRTRDEFVPAVFPTERHLNSTFQAATRTGLVVGASGWGRLEYETTPLMEEVAALAPFRDALENEGGYL